MHMLVCNKQFIIPYAQYEHKKNKALLLLNLMLGI